MTSDPDAMFEVPLAPLTAPVAAAAAGQKDSGEIGAGISGPEPTGCS